MKDVEEDGQVTVPGSESDLRTIWEFALSYNGSERHGGFDRAAAIGNECLETWEHDRRLPSDLATARAALF